MGQLCSDIDLLTDTVLFKNFADSGFTARVHIGGVIIVDAAMKGSHNLLLGFCHIDFTEGGLKTHAAEAEERDLVVIFVKAIAL